MTSTPTLAALTAAAFLIAAPAFAQTAAEQTPGTDTAPETAPAAEAAPAPPPPPEFVREAFGDWETRCNPEKTNCFMYQLARDNTANPVAEVSIVALPDAAEAFAGATVVTPLGTLLTEGLVVQVDSGQGRRYDYSFCNRSGCFARFGMEEGFVNNLKRGAVARMQILSVGAPDRPVVLEVSLTGFTAAFESLPPAPAQ